jgi:hypothetical protein
MAFFGDRVVFSSCLCVLLIFLIVHGFVVNKHVLLCGHKQTKGTTDECSKTGPHYWGHQFFYVVGLFVLGLDTARLATGNSLCCAALRNQ